MPWKVLFREYIEVVLVVIVIAAILRAMVISVDAVPSNTMAPSLQTGDIVAGFKLSYGLSLSWLGIENLGTRRPHRGDLVLFRRAKTGVRYIRRVVGLPGDHVAVTGDGKITVNDAALDNDEEEAPSVLIVPEKAVFVAADQSKGSGDALTSDSRTWGTVALDEIESKIFMVWVSNDPQKGFLWSRFFKFIY